MWIYLMSLFHKGKVILLKVRMFMKQCRIYPMSERQTDRTGPTPPSPVSGQSKRALNRITHRTAAACLAWETRVTNCN